MPPVRFNAQKWARNAAASADEYAQGAQSPRVPWAAAAAAAEANYGSAVQEAISRGAFGKGVLKAGDVKFQAGVRDKGQVRYRGAVLLPISVQNLQAGFGPFQRVIESVQLPPRGPKGTNFQRSELIGQALLAAKRQQT